MALFDSGTPLANVALSDTFNTWRIRTNQINTQAAGLASNNIFTGANNTFNGTVNAPTVVANTFIGDGSQLTNAGSTVATQTATNVELGVPFTGVTSGTMTSANVNSSFTFNPSSNTLTAEVLKTSDLQDSSGRTLTIRDQANTIVWGG